MKFQFILRHFNPVGTISTTTSTINIPSHFFNTNEELTYTPDSTFIGIAGTAISIGSTANIAGVVTTLLPSTVYAKVIDENRFELYTRPEYVSTGIAVTFTGFGGGNAHKLTMRKPLTKTIIGLDGVVQQPISFTSITHNRSFWWIYIIIGIGLISICIKWNWICCTKRFSLKLMMSM